MSRSNQVSLTELNSQGWYEFVGHLGNVVEHNPNCASAVWGNRPFNSVDSLQQAFEDFLDLLPQQGKEGVLRLFPDIAGKQFQADNLSPESKKEQAAAGVDTITDEVRTTITELNHKYKQKFRIPFVICARENKVHSILNGLQFRLEHTKDNEVLTGINEVKKICNLRLRDLVVDEGRANA